MENDIQQVKKTYTTKDVATLLDMAISTVRKYAQYLEKAGYLIIKTEGKARIFTESDIMVLRYLKELRDNTNITVEQATNVVVEKFNKEEIQVASSEDTAIIMQYEKRYEEMESKLNEQTELIKKLSVRLDKTENQRDKKDDVLIQNMKKLLEALRTLIQEDNKKKSWFTRILSK